MDQLVESSPLLAAERRIENTRWSEIGRLVASPPDQRKWDAPGSVGMIAVEPVDEILMR